MYDGKIWCQQGVLAPPGRTILTNEMCMAPNSIGGHVKEGMCNGDIIVDRVLVCPVEHHPKWVAIGTCAGYC